MEIRQIDHKLSPELTDGTIFADDVNNVYPLDNEEKIKISAKALKNKDFGVYNMKEKFLITSRIITAGNKLGITEQIKDDIKAYFGGNMDTYTQEQVDKLIAQAKDESKKIYDKQLDELKQSIEHDVDANSKINALNEELKTHEETITSLEHDKKELEDKIVEANDKIDKLQLDIIKRDRTMKIVAAFEDIDIDTDLKKTKIQSLIDISASFDDERFNEFIEAEINFIKQTAKNTQADVQKKDDLVNASDNVINADDSHKVSAADILAKYISKL